MEGTGIGKPKRRAGTREGREGRKQGARAKREEKAEEGERNKRSAKKESGCALEPKETQERTRGMKMEGEERARRNRATEKIR